MPNGAFLADDLNDARVTADLGRYFDNLPIAFMQVQSWLIPLDFMLLISPHLASELLKCRGGPDPCLADFNLWERMP